MDLELNRNRASLSKGHPRPSSLYQCFNVTKNGASFSKEEECFRMNSDVTNTIPKAIIKKLHLLLACIVPGIMGQCSLNDQLEFGADYTKVTGSLKSFKRFGKTLSKVSKFSFS